jgi:glucokinase
MQSKSAPETTQLVTVDIGGTHARFAIASVQGPRVVALSNELVAKTADFASFESAWDSFASKLNFPQPRDAAIAVACPVQGEILKLTNNPWVIRRAALQSSRKLRRLTIINDFGAIAYAVAQFTPEDFSHISGPVRPLPREGVISILGPGTGLGVAQLIRRGGRQTVIETEGGHLDFAPVDPMEDRILHWLRERYRRVSVERLLSGPGLANWYEGLNRIEGSSCCIRDEATLWTAALAGTHKDKMVSAALERLCLSFGSFAGNIALAHGASAVVIAGGVGQRLADHLPLSGFSHRFVAKGRFEHRLADLPVKVVNHPHPGLTGAAAAFAEEYSV